MALTVTDLFAGGGGSSEGLRRAGYDIWIATNHWPVSVATHQTNHPDTEHRTADLTNTSFGTYPRTDVLWASPSCTRHSVASRTRQGSTEDELRRDTADKVDRATAFAVLAAAEIHGYEAVIVENVREFQNWVLFPMWLAGMRALGYREQIVHLNAAEVGPVPVAQDRRRLFIVFTRDGRVDLTVPTVPRTPVTTILDPDAPFEVLGDRRLYVSPQIDSIPDIDVPHVVTYRRNAKPRRADTQQLYTITAGGNHHALAMRTADGPVHRWLTTLELSRAQGFSDSYVFTGTDSQVRRQIGNAVAVNVAQFLGERVAAALGEQQPDLVAA
ncbi:DNA cytosine methyltransferase [Nocardia rhizosphaerae]|uniref:DNA (cytosine-5-)-methyltransferase n=1 Tax=Nocardia rhizosphaerae TaxID=1691571 RepID=A0ABV8LDH2_9NOCA